jgi:ElaB/YqjD/DUF883 family membrane-anchored ribosome-binding protein
MAADATTTNPPLISQPPTRADPNRVDSSDYPSHSSQQARASIAQTRADMNQTVDAIRQRLDSDVKQFTLQLTDTTMKTAQDFASKTVQAIEKNPLPLLLLGVGAGWLAYTAMTSSSRSQSQSQSSEPGNDHAQGLLCKVSQDAKALAQRVGQTADRWGNAALASAERIAPNTTHEVEHLANEALSATRSAASNLSRRGEQAYEKASHLAHEASQQSRSAIHDHPMAFAGGAFLVGLGVGLIIPMTRREIRTLGPALENTAHRLVDAGRHTIERGVDAAEHAVGAVSHAVNDAVKEVVGEPVGKSS